MDASTLHSLTEDLAGFLSELTPSELPQPTSCASRDVGTLYLHLIDRNLSVAEAITGEAITQGQWPDPTDRASLEDVLDHYYGGGLEAGYRRTARLMEGAFDSATDRNLLCHVKGLPEEVDIETLYELQISDAILHTWDIAQVLGFSYQPPPAITLRILRTIVLGAERAHQAVDDGDLFEGVLKLSGRSAGQR